MSHFKILGAQKGGNEERTYWGSTNIRLHHTKLSCHGDLAPPIGAALSVPLVNPRSSTDRSRNVAALQCSFAFIYQEW